MAWLPVHDDKRTVSDEELQPQVTLQGFTCLERTTILPDLGSAVESAGGCVLDMRSQSASKAELWIEVQHRSLPSVYGALLGSGLELTRDSHRTLAERCNCNLHLPSPGVLSPVLTLCVEVTFLAERQPLTEISRLMLMTAATA